MLQDYFGQYGELVECRLVVDKHSNKSRGFGFVAYGDPDSSQACLAQRHTIFGKVLSGYDVVDKISKVQAGPGNKPIEDVVMLEVTVSTKKPKVTSKK